MRILLFSIPKARSLKLKRRKTHSHGNKDTRLIVIYQQLHLRCLRCHRESSQPSHFESLKLRNYVDAAMTASLDSRRKFIEVNSCGKFKECFPLASIMQWGLRKGDGELKRSAFYIFLTLLKRILNSLCKIYGSEFTIRLRSGGKLLAAGLFIALTVCTN